MDFGRDEFGRGFNRNADARLARVESKIEDIVNNDTKTRGDKQRLGKLMKIRDRLRDTEVASMGARMAVDNYREGTGWGSNSGIRGMQVIENDYSPEAIRQFNVDGQSQGLRQASVAPPGSGRLVGIPFVVSGAVVPVVAVVGGAAVLGATTSLVTKAINWAALRIVGLTTQTIAAATGVVGVMQDFKIGGSANLFLDESWVLMDDYDTDKEQFAGLRAYPTLVSPNVASVDLAAFAPASQTLYAAVTLVTEVLRDDAFGVGFPGPYSR